MLKWLDCINFWLDWILLQTACHTSLLRRLHCPLENEWENGERTERDSVPAKYRQGDDLLRKLARAYKSNLNPSTIHVDGCGEGAWWNRGGPQASLEGNHDNPVSGTHQAPSHWEPLWKKAQILSKKNIQSGGRVGGKTQLELLHAKATWAKTIDFSKSAVKSLRPC